MLFFFFFFQAEDGIRDSSVTGVQTCALPISALPGNRNGDGGPGLPFAELGQRPARRDRKSVVEGKSVDLGGRRIIKKNKKTTVSTTRHTPHGTTSGASRS